MRGILPLACACATAANLHRATPRTLCPLRAPRLGAANQKVSPPDRSGNGGRVPWPGAPGIRT
eukprot:8979124-Pyramimonas_sp.AAC.1